jgi:hypothetical protein
MPNYRRAKIPSFPSSCLGMHIGAPKLELGSETIAWTLSLSINMRTITLR